MSDFIAWIDVETSGTNIDTSTLLEIGLVVTDMSGNKIFNTFTTTFKIPNLAQVISNSTPYVIKMHDKSGLWKDLWNLPGLNNEDADHSIYEILSDFSDDVVYFGGNSIQLDRNFVSTYLPKTYSLISHRSIDVTTLSLVLKENTDFSSFVKEVDHRALLDVLDSIREYKYYLNLINSLSDK